jgi:hypothetical protein
MSIDERVRVARPALRPASDTSATQVVEEWRSRELLWTDRSALMTMRTVRGGSERVRELRLLQRRITDGEQRTAMFFVAPDEVRGTGLLTFVHPDRAAEQWLYLPDLLRTRQIAARLGSESFVGTDLTYRDLDVIQSMPFWSDRRVTIGMLGEEPLAGTMTDVLTMVPKTDDIGYREIVVWLGRDDGVPRQIEFYDADLVRRLWQSDVWLVDGIPVAHHGEVESPLTATRTVIDVSEVRFDEGLEPGIFTTAGLERGLR